MACSRRGSSRKRSSLIQHTWQHVSSPVLIDTPQPVNKQLATSPLGYNAAEPLSGSLWSGEWKLFADTNSSDWPGQSVASSTSWSDELESESTRKLSEQFEQLECSLYSDCNELNLPNSSLATECQQWKGRFPHLRVVGTRAKLASQNQTSSKEESLTCEKSEAVVSAVEKGVDDDNEEEEEEEVIAAHGDIDQQVVVVSSPLLVGDDNDDDDVNSSSKLVPIDEVPDFRVKVKKAVSDQIFSIVWPDVVKRIEPMFKKLLERNKATLSHHHHHHHQVPALTISTHADSSICSSSDAGFEESSATTTTDNFVQVSPKPMRDSSGRKSRMRTISHITANLIDYSNDFHQTGRTAAAAAVATAGGGVGAGGDRSSAVKLIFPAAAEKLLSPIAAAAAVPAADNRSAARRASAKLSASSNRSRLMPSFQHKCHEDEQMQRTRFCSRTETRSGALTGRKTSPLSNWTRHGVLPPINLKENMKISSAFSKRSSSALQQNEPNDLDARPNTSLPNKNMHCLQPLDKFEAKENLAVRMELAQQWLRNQIAPNSYGKNHLTLNDNMNNGWRSKMNGIYWK